MLLSKIKEIKNGRVIVKDSKTIDELFDVFAIRNGSRQKFNNKPLTSAEADQLVEDIERSSIPSVKKGSAERILIYQS